MKKGSKWQVAGGKFNVVAMAMLDLPLATCHLPQGASSFGQSPGDASYFSASAP